MSINLNGQGIQIGSGKFNEESFLEIDSYLNNNKNKSRDAKRAYNHKEIGDKMPVCYLVKDMILDDEEKSSEILKNVL